MPDRLAGKVALVTGGNSGIGRAAAQRLAARGVRVVITGRDRARGADTQKALTAAGAEARFVEMNAASEDSIRRAVERTISEFGGLDFLVNNAGFEGPVGPITDLSEEACDQLLAVNIKGPMMASKHALPHMLRRGGGSIVNVASFLATIPFPPNPGYAATKAALIHLTRSLAAGYGDQGVDCYAVCPYITNTPMIDRVSGGNDGVRQQLASMNPSGRIAAPDDIGRAIVDLIAGETNVPRGSAVLIDTGGAISTAA